MPKRKGEREGLVRSMGGSDIESKRAGGVWASIYKQVYDWALGLVLGHPKALV